MAFAASAFAFHTPLPSDAQCLCGNQNFMVLATFASTSTPSTRRLLDRHTG
jgi:hypothetical protein